MDAAGSHPAVPRELLVSTPPSAVTIARKSPRERRAGSTRRTPARSAAAPHEHPRHGEALEVVPEHPVGGRRGLVRRLATTTPPALPRPPTWTCTFTTPPPPSSRPPPGVLSAKPRCPGRQHPVGAKRSLPCARRGPLGIPRRPRSAFRRADRAASPRCLPCRARGEDRSMPASLSLGMSSAGMTPPPKTTTSSAPRSRSRSTTLGNSVMWAPEWLDNPTASASSWIAASAICSGV